MGQVSPLRPPVASASACPFPFLGENMGENTTSLVMMGSWVILKNLSKEPFCESDWLQYHLFEVPGEAYTLSKFECKSGIPIHYLSCRNGDHTSCKNTVWSMETASNMLLLAVSCFPHQGRPCRNIQIPRTTTHKQWIKDSKCGAYWSILYWKNLRTHKLLTINNESESTPYLSRTSHSCIFVPLPCRKSLFLHDPFSKKTTLATKLNKPIKLKRSNQLQKG